MPQWIYGPWLGRTYYVNKVTKETQWHLPTDAGGSDWVPKLDAASGRTYYVNTATKQSQWHPPSDQPQRSAITADNFEGVFSASGTSHLRP